MEYALFQACDSGEAFELYERERPDLVLTDVMRSMMDGYEAARREEQEVQLRCHAL